MTLGGTGLVRLVGHQRHLRFPRLSIGRLDGLQPSDEARPWSYTNAFHTTHDCYNGSVRSCGMSVHFLYIEVNVKQRVSKWALATWLRVSPQINDGGGAALMNWCKLHFL
jgi:hypothetical protein